MTWSDRFCWVGIALQLGHMFWPDLTKLRLLRRLVGGVWFQWPAETRWRRFERQEDGSLSYHDFVGGKPLRIDLARSAPESWGIQYEDYRPPHVRATDRLRWEAEREAG